MVYVERICFVPTRQTSEVISLHDLKAFFLPTWIAEFIGIFHGFPFQGKLLVDLHRHVMANIFVMIAFVGIPDLVVNDLKLIEQMRSERKLLAHLSASYFVKKSAAFGV